MYLPALNIHTPHPTHKLSRAAGFIWVATYCPMPIAEAGMPLGAIAA
jgi:hypothetical protein